MQTFRSHRAPRRRNDGSSMIEVLVAIVILVFGVLGVAAMQATALRNSQSSMDHSQAVVQINTILDRMRANVPQARIGAYNLGHFGTSLAPPPVAGTTVWTCALPDDGATLPVKDRRAWMQALKTNLGQSACGIIDCGDIQCDIGVRWDDQRGSGVDPNATSGPGSSNQMVLTRSRL